MQQGHETQTQAPSRNWEKKGIAAVTGCYLLWGVLPVYWKLLDQVDPVYILSSRILWSLVFCGLIILLMNKGRMIGDVFRDKKEFWMLFACGILISINWGVYIYAVNTGHIIESSLAYYMNPIISIAIGTVAFREKLDLIQWLSVGIAVFGVMISVLHYGQVPYLALSIGLPFSVYGALKKKVKADGEVSIFVETLCMAPFAFLYILHGELSGNGAFGLLEGAWLFLLPLCGVVTTIPLALFAQGVKHTPLTLSGILMYINPTLQLAIGIFVYRESFTLSDAVTFGFVWIALLLFVGRGLLKDRGARAVKECSFEKGCFEGRDLYENQR